MELVDGPTLAAGLERGPVPLEEALTIGRQVAEALETAHDKGIVHRDLKPNVMLTSAGVVKVLDFGLAGVTSRSRRSNSRATSSSSVNVVLTQASSHHSGVGPRIKTCGQAAMR